MPCIDMLSSANSTAAGDNDNRKESPPDYKENDNGDDDFEFMFEED